MAVLTELLKAVFREHPPRRRGSGWLSGWRALPPALLLLLTGAAATADSPTEYEVKAAFVHNIAKFVEWPASAGVKETLRLCILGPGPFGAAAEGLRGKPVGSKLWEVAPANARANLKECQVLFVGAAEAANLPRLLEGLKGSPVLTVGDTEGYAERGVMVNLFLEQNKVRFEINNGAAGRAGLRISSQLLKLARIVAEPGAAK